MKIKSIKSIILAAAVSAGSLVYGGNVFLTGHDVLLHGGQSGYDGVVLEYLRDGEGTKATYDVLYITSGGTSSGLASVIAEGYSVTTISHAAFGADPATALAGADVMVLPWIFDGGAPGSAAVVSAAAEIETFFNAGGDIWANSSFTTTTYYDFLPPSAAAAGPSISGSSGFVPTAAGAAIGLTSAMVNGRPTHNKFDSFDPAFTVMETRPLSGGGEEVIAIGLKGGTIVTTSSGGTSIVVTTGTTTSGPGVPDSGSSTLLLLLGVSAIAALRRFTK